MRKLAALLAVLFIPLSVFAQDTWTHDPFHSKLGFTVTHLGIADVPIVFDDDRVTITASVEDFSDAQVELTIHTASLNTRVSDRDAHLRSSDFFHVDEYPEMTFSSNSIRKIDDGVYELTGDLTLLETTKEVTVTLVHRYTIANPMDYGLPFVGINITATKDRRNFKLGYEIHPPLISNVMRIKADCDFGIQ